MVLRVCLLVNGCVVFICLRFCYLVFRLVLGYGLTLDCCCFDWLVWELRLGSGFGVIDVCIGMVWCVDNALLGCFDNTVVAAVCLFLVV